MRIFFALLLIASCFASCTSDNTTNNFPSTSTCKGFVSQSLPEYINDFKNKDFFIVNGKTFKGTGDSIPYGTYLSIPADTSTLDISTRTYVTEMEYETGIPSYRLVYLLLETDGCPLLLEAYEFDTIPLASSIHCKTELTIWQKQDSSWKKVTRDYFPLEKIKHRFKVWMDDTLNIREKDNVIHIHHDNYKRRVSGYDMNCPSNSPVPTMAFDRKGFTTLVWEEGKFDFLLNQEEFDKIIAISDKCTSPISTNYIGMMGLDKIVDLKMDLTKRIKHQTTAFTGVFEVRGEEPYKVKGELTVQVGSYNEQFQQVKMQLYKQEQVVAVFEGTIKSSAILHLEPKEIKSDDFAEIKELNLVQKDLLQKIIKPELASKTYDYSNEIFTNLAIALQYNYQYTKHDAWRHVAYNHVKEEDGKYQPITLYDAIKSIDKLDDNHFVYGVEGDIDFANFGLNHNLADYFSYKGLMHHVLINKEEPMILEYGQLQVTTMQEYLPGACGDEDEVSEEYYYTESLLFIKVWKRTKEGLWKNVSKELLPSQKDFLLALKGYYPDFLLKKEVDRKILSGNGNIAAFANLEGPKGGGPFYSFSNLKEVETHEEMKAASPTTFDLNWENNSLSIGKGKLKLNWENNKFNLQSEDAVSEKVCFDGNVFTASESKGFQYEGTINKGDKIGMQLIYSNENGEYYVEGAYWYTAKKKPIKLSGMYIPSTKEVHLNRLVDGRITEIFTGKIDNDCRITGLWKKGEQELPFVIGAL